MQPEREIKHTEFNYFDVVQEAVNRQFSLLSNKARDKIICWIQRGMADAHIRGQIFALESLANTAKTISTLEDLRTEIKCRHKASSELYGTHPKIL